MIQKKLNKRLTVYLSKSLLIPEVELKPVRDRLTGLGFKVTEYRKETEYSNTLISNADFVVFITKYNPIFSSNHDITTYVGKGQLNEAVDCKYKGKPAFMIHGITKDDILISKLVGDDYKPHENHIITDRNDWKNKYGIIKSYVIGISLVPLFPMLEGMFGLKDLNEYPLRPNQAFQVNNRLLLLLK